MSEVAFSYTTSWDVAAVDHGSVHNIAEVG
jgi:hypothetical protein